MRIGKFPQDNPTVFHPPTFRPTIDESQVTREPGYTSARECLRPDSTVIPLTGVMIVWILKCWAENDCEVLSLGSSKKSAVIDS